MLKFGWSVGWTMQLATELSKSIKEVEIGNIWVGSDITLSKQWKFGGDSRRVPCKVVLSLTH